MGAARAVADARTFRSLGRSRRRQITFPVRAIVDSSARRTDADHAAKSLYSASIHDPSGKGGCAFERRTTVEDRLDRRRGDSHAGAFAGAPDVSFAEGKDFG